ncbi:MAG: nitroreductase family protein [Candidatus Altiarchaeota archaeon]|nr:nitroreductase family protein [Candidatus Altiarchaeota archaeon]
MADHAKDIFEVIKRRRTCRFFQKNADIPPKDLEMILEAGRWAPSARNLQPLEYIVVRHAEKRKKLAELGRQKHPCEAPVSVVVLGDMELAVRVGKISPHETTTSFKGLKMFLYMDAAAAIENMLLMAESMEYASLWISSFDEEGLEDYFKLSENMVPLAILCFGKTSKKIQVPPKRPLDERLHYEEWSQKPRDESYIGFSRKINQRF